MSEPSKTPRKRRQPRKVTQQSLHNAALHYLERYASSADNLRRVLMRRVRRSALVHDTDPEEGARLIDELVTRFEAAGLLDDRAYAAAARRNIIVYFGVSGVVSLAIFLTGGLMTGQVWLLIAILAPIYGLSLWLGARLFGRASEQAFRRFALGLIALVAASSLVI